MSCRSSEPGYIKIGLTCSAGRRSLWFRINPTQEEKARQEERRAQFGDDCAFLYAIPANIESFELCAGREGDDNYVKVDHTNPQFAELLGLLLCAQFASET